MRGNIFFIVVLSIFLGSCFSPRGIQYFTDYDQEFDFYNIASSKDKKIEPNDLLYITVNSYEELDAMMLSSNSAGIRLGSAEMLYLVGYSVSDSGYLDYPLVGRVKVDGLTVYQAADRIEEKLAGFLNSPSVTVRYINRTITVLGEVNRPGEIPFSRDQITIFQALGMAGDLTQSGNRKEVVVFRPEGNKLHKEVINLKESDILLSEYYYMQPNDVIYVKPMASARFRIASSAYSLVLSTLTTSLVLYQAFR